MPTSCDPLFDILRRVVNQDLVGSAVVLLEFFRHDMDREFGSENARHPFLFLLLKGLVGRGAGEEDRFKVARRLPQCHASFDKFQFGEEALVGVDHFPEPRSIELTGMLAGEMLDASVEIGEHTVEVQENLKFGVKRHGSLRKALT